MEDLRGRIRLIDPKFPQKCWQHFLRVSLIGMVSVPAEAIFCLFLFAVVVILAQYIVARNAIGAKGSISQAGQGSDKVFTMDVPAKKCREFWLFCEWNKANKWG